MDEIKNNSPCKEFDDGTNDVPFHPEVEHLRQHLAERDAHILAIEGELIKYSSQTKDLDEQVNTWREKYERLYDSHKRVQKLNQVLEDKLLQMVDKMKSEKSQLTKDIATLSVRLAESKHNYSMLQKENERYKNDMNLAIQLLQCKPDNFVSQKLDNLPVDTQARVSQYVMSKTSKSLNSVPPKVTNENDTFDASEYEFNISASLMSKILEDSIQDTLTKHCDTCTCNKSQSKPFCYNESYYSVATQTHLSGDINSSLCLNCSTEIKSMQPTFNLRNASPQKMRLHNDRTISIGLTGPMYIMPQMTKENHKVNQNRINDNILDDENVEIDNNIEKASSNDFNKGIVHKFNDNFKHIGTKSANTEPAIHHKLCDRTKTSDSSKKSSTSLANDDLLFKDILSNKETKTKADNLPEENTNMRKNSHSSIGAFSKTSSVAKSTVSNHKPNTQVGPGPRFCHLRMQAGSKNILLDNAQPDVPPVLYRRQSKCNDNLIFKEFNEGTDNYIDPSKDEEVFGSDMKNDNMVVESTLIDVHVDNNNKESNVATENTSFNPLLLNVSSSPLQPQKTHNFSNGSEHNNNNSNVTESHQITSEIDNLFSNLNVTTNNNENNKMDCETSNVHENILQNDNKPIDNLKIFNFDHYEQTKLGGQYMRPVRKIDMSHLHSLENTKLSIDPSQDSDFSTMDKKIDSIAKSPVPAVVNVYPNLTQTHLKVNDKTKAFTNEQSTSSLSSDDSAALLQKQQLLRVAEWVEKNLEQQNTLNDLLEDDVNFNDKSMRREAKMMRLTETLNELALNMPHPVSKYSKNYPRINNNPEKPKQSITKTKIVKETIFPAECGEAITENNAVDLDNDDKDVKEDCAKYKGEKKITPEELARMEYNVKKFLLSGPHWVSPDSVSRYRRTSSKTETDV